MTPPESRSTSTSATRENDSGHGTAAQARARVIRRIARLRHRIGRVRGLLRPLPKLLAVAAGAIGAIGLVLLSAIALGNRRFGRATRTDVERLNTTTTDTGRARRYDPAAASDLPEPVRRYLETVLSPGQPVVQRVELTQDGEFSLGDATVDWLPMTATQHFTVDPPGFVWDADIQFRRATDSRFSRVVDNKFVPGIAVRVVDRYLHGNGSLDARLLSALPVASVDASPEMNDAELLRYLGETVWFPTALLPGNSIEWAAIDDTSARATIHDHGNTASLVFHFDDDDLIERVTTPARYRQDEDDDAPWTGSFDQYAERNGILLPTHAAAEWNRPDGDQQYWRADITSIDHHTQ